MYLGDPGAGSPRIPDVPLPPNSNAFRDTVFSCPPRLSCLVRWTEVDPPVPFVEDTSLKVLLRLLVPPPRVSATFPYRAWTIRRDQPPSDRTELVFLRRYRFHISILTRIRRGDGYFFVFPTPVFLAGPSTLTGFRYPDVCTFQLRTHALWWILHVTESLFYSARLLRVTRNPFHPSLPSTRGTFVSASWVDPRPSS